MEERRKDLKQKARRALTGRYPVAVGAIAAAGAVSLLLVVMCQICMVFSGILALSAGNAEKRIFAPATVLGFCMLAFFLFHFLLIPGILRLFLNICQEREAGVWDIFWGFHNRGGRFLGIGLAVILLTAFFSVPIIVLAAAAEATGDWQFVRMFLIWYNLLLAAAWIYVSLTYGQFFMILADEPEKSLLRSLEESREMMKGRRLRLLMLWLSFLGWVPVVYMTLGVGLLWLIPYITCTYTFFYLGIKKRRQEDQE